MKSYNSHDPDPEKILEQVYVKPASEELRQQILRAARHAWKVQEPAIEWLQIFRSTFPLALACLILCCYAVWDDRQIQPILVTQQHSEFYPQELAEVLNGNGGIHLLLCFNAQAYPESKNISILHNPLNPLFRNSYENE